MRPSNGIQDINGGNAPQTPNTGFARAASIPGQSMRAPQPQPAQLQPGQTIIPGRVLNQPNRVALPTPASPVRVTKPLNPTSSDPNLPPPGKGFYSARAAAMVPEATTVDALPPSHNPNLPAFNPHLESPSIRKTPGVDHKSSKPLTKDLKHVPGNAQPPAAPVGRPGMGRGGIVNPQLDAARQIGAPGSRLSSPLQNRGSYKPPSIKRPIDTGGFAERAPLANLPANEPIGPGDQGGGDVKRQRMDG
jgi:DNA repair and recombination protein RAD52